ncbi:MAG: adenylosuccinate synthase [Nitrospirae bacterium]|uniref:adenylosuccinate synthase n=1 Tax=Candidatus Magnetobacterium casense TaxID=1455061 RepID=UPI00058E6C71|nr:adenylosuccinate synthase [Candidatus Magnetobacterium casensis]MBF0337815.1 adenylosuccinate synthase [Nitrospirota bacterium]
MPNIVIVGAQWGDEGKGKIVDCLTETSDVVARYQGGHNAGHTVVIGNEKFILHLLPSGILHKEKLCIIGNGLVVELSALVEEIDALRMRGVAVGSNLKVSKAAHLIMPYHVALDQLRESAKGDKKIGTTGRGIGPAYTDKAARTGVRVSDLFYPDVLREKLQYNLTEKNLIIEKLYGGKPVSLDEAYDTTMSFRDKIEPFVDDTDVTINGYISQGKHILFEGAQGTMLDIDHGTYHCVTSSSACAGGALTGLGVGPKVIDEVLGVAKAYTTRVGGGPFPTELEDATGEMLREHGGEYGATTGRARRCGWLDLVVLRHAVRINGLTGIVITKLDVLDGLSSVSVCVGYRYGGKVLTEFPKEMTILEQSQPVYEQFDGWSSTAGVRDFQGLPDNARAYLKMIQERLNVPIVIVSTGQDRDDTIFLKDLR